MENPSPETQPLLTINSKVTAEDSIRFAFFHHYSRTATKVVIVFGALLIVFMNGQFLFAPDTTDTTNQILFFIVVFTLLIVPVLIYIKARKNYVTQKTFSESIQWRFGHESIEVVAQTFSSTFTWDSLYKVVENKRFFLLYQSATLASIIPKSHMSENQMFQFRQLLRDIPHLKSELLYISPGMDSQNNGLTLASTGIRIINAFIDTIVFLLLWALLTLGFFLLLVLLEVPDKTTDSLTNLPWIVLLPFYLMYYLFAESRFQKTVGKLLTRTIVVSTNGNKPTIKQIIIRTLSRIIPFEFITFLFGSACLHDQLSKTRVIQIPKRNNLNS